MEPVRHEPTYAELSVTHAEADEMLRMVLAGQTPAEPGRPLREVATALGMSEEHAHKILQEIRTRKEAEQENMRVKKGLNREKNVMRMALLCSMFGIALIGTFAYFGSRFLAPPVPPTFTGATVSVSTSPSQSGVTVTEVPESVHVYGPTAATPATSADGDSATATQPAHGEDLSTAPQAVGG